MARRLRHFCPNTLYLLTNTVAENEARLEATPEMEALIYGLLLKYAYRYGVRFSGFMFMPHYFKILASGPNQNLHQFMCQFQSHLSRELNRRQGRSGSVFPKRYLASAVLLDAQEAVFRDLLRSPVDEQFVLHPGEWPGASAWRALTDGSERQFTAKRADSSDFWLLRRNPAYDKYSNEEIHELAASTYRTILAKLPVWEGLSDEEYAQKIRTIGDEIQEQASATLNAASPPEANDDLQEDDKLALDNAPKTNPAKEVDSTPNSAAASIDQKKFPTREELMARSPRQKCRPWKPLYHGLCITFDEKLNQEFMEQTHDREANYDRAASKLRLGVSGAYFPRGMIPPGHLYCVGSPDAVRTGQNPIAPQELNKDDDADAPNMKEAQAASG